MRVVMRWRLIQGDHASHLKAVGIGSAPSRAEVFRNGMDGNKS